MRSTMAEKTIRFLRWTETYTKTDMVYLAKGGGWLSLGQLASSLAGFGLIVFTTNMLKPEVLGEYRFLLSIFLILGVFSLPGMQTAILESTPKGYLGNLQKGFKEMIRFGSIGFVISLFISAYYFYAGNISLALGMLVVAVAIPFFDSSALFNFHLKALKEFKKVTAYNLVTRLFMLTGVVIATIFFTDFAWIILLAFLLSQIIPSLYFHFKTKREYSQDAETDSQLLTYAKHLTFMASFAFVATQFDKIMIWKFIGSEDLALFYVAYAIPLEIQRFLQIIPQLAFPKFSTGDISQIKATLLGKIWKYALVILSVTFVYILLCPFIFKTLFPLYEEAVLYSQVLAASIMVSAFFPIHTFLASQKNIKGLYMISFLVPALRLISAFILIFTLGIWGIIISIFVEGFARAFLLVYFLLRHNDKNTTDYQLQT